MSEYFVKWLVKFVNVLTTLFGIVDDYEDGDEEFSMQIMIWFPDQAIRGGSFKNVYYASWISNKMHDWMRPSINIWRAGACSRIDVPIITKLEQIYATQPQMMGVSVSVYVS